MEFENVIQGVTNSTIYDSFVKAKQVIETHDCVSVSISGGADSDIVLDLIEKVREPDKEIHYVWFNTGLEYQATKDHIKELEQKYGVEIEEHKPIKSIPLSVREFGVPFVSKYVSEMMERLQAHDFKWEDEPFDVLLQKYPKCKSALKWWCNEHEYTDKIKSYDIGYNKYLKEFILLNPPTFKVSNSCCYYAKKLVGKKTNIELNADLNCVGVRKAEGGIRGAKYKTCYETSDEKWDEFRPILWYKDSDKVEYEDAYNIEHSKCYTQYGLKRTGCVGCPYNRYFEDELNIIQKYEPKLYNACINIFGKSYEYTRKYKEFCKEMREKESKIKRNS